MQRQPTEKTASRSNQGEHHGHITFSSSGSSSEKSVLGDVALGQQSVDCCGAMDEEKSDNIESSSLMSLPPTAENPFEPRPLHPSVEPLPYPVATERYDTHYAMDRRDSLLGSSIRSVADSLVGTFDRFSIGSLSGSQTIELEGSRRTLAARTGSLASLFEAFPQHHPHQELQTFFSSHNSYYPSSVRQLLLLPHGMRHAPVDNNCRAEWPGVLPLQRDSERIQPSCSPIVPLFPTQPVIPTRLNNHKPSKLSKKSSQDTVKPENIIYQSLEITPKHEKQMIKLRECMVASEKTQKDLQEWDKQQGLPRSHSNTMVNTSRSRTQLLEGKILRKWDGKPLLDFGETVSPKRMKRFVDLSSKDS